MKIWIINAQENPPEPISKIGRRQWRSNSLSETLANRGHDVIRWRSSFSHQKKEQLSSQSSSIRVNNFNQQFIYSPSYKHHIGFKRFRHHIQLGNEFLRLAKQSELPDVINVCNVPLELCNACISFGEKNDIPVIIDIRDLWPDSYLNFLPKKIQFLKKPLLRLINLFSYKVRRSYSKATAITAITKPILDWGLKKAPNRNNSLDAVFPMAYPKTNPIKKINKSELRIKYGVRENSLIACYSGNIGYQTDFDTFLLAAKLIESNNLPIHFIIAGSGPRENEIKEKSSKLSNVTVTGWLSGSELRELFEISSFGLLGFFNVKDYIKSLPNKFSEYLSAGLALVCGTKGEMAKWINDYECGINYKSMDAESLYTEISKLIKHEKEVIRLKRNAKNLHLKHFDHDVVIPLLADHVERVAHNK